MSAQKVFDNEDLREYILSFLYSFDKIIEMKNFLILSLTLVNQIYPLKLVGDFEEGFLCASSLA